MDVPTKATSSYANAPKATNYSGIKGIGFIRNRDIKLKESEQRREDYTAKVMIEGICKKCREKVQWRFKFDKYKPLKAVGNCQGCKQKAVTKAYRTWCDKCAEKKNCCSSCLNILVDSDAVDYVAPETVFAVVKKVDHGGKLHEDAGIVVVNADGTTSLVKEAKKEKKTNVEGDVEEEEGSEGEEGDDDDEEEGDEGEGEDEDDEQEEATEAIKGVTFDSNTK
jgi:hypothetical protein